MSLSFYPFIVLCCPGSHVKKKEVLSFTKKKHAAVNSAEERICPFYQLIHMNVIMGGNYICLVVCLLSVMKCRVYTTPLCFYYKNPPYDTQTHTHNHTQREREREKREKKLVARFLKYPLGKIKHLKSEPDHYSLL